MPKMGLVLQGGWALGAYEYACDLADVGREGRNGQTKRSEDWYDPRRPSHLFSTEIPANHSTSGCRGRAKASAFLHERRGERAH